jgi:hypothetical protein
MTIIRKYSFIRKVKDISISGSLALAILGNSVMLQSYANQGLKVN